MQQQQEQGYYIETPEQLRAAVAERKRQQPEIRVALNRWMKEEFGIPDMSGITNAFFDQLGISQEGPVGVLARQIGTVNTEGVSFHLGCESLGIDSATLTFGRDQFSVHSLDKRAAVQVPWIRWSRKGNLVIEKELVVPKAKNIVAIDQMALDRILTDSGATLTEHHHDLRKVFFGDDLPYLDISDLLVQYLHTARDSAKPGFAHVTSEGGRVDQVQTQSLNGQIARPPAKWYYPLYFTWFLDGRMVLFETYENTSGQVAEAKLLFQRAMELVREKTGFYPLVVRTPVLSEDMLYCNRALVEKPNAIGELRELVSEIESAGTTSIHDFLRRIADGIVGFR